jgi:zinc-finger of transposase IS204/IS1001/IS1096/IS1165
LRVLNVLFPHLAGVMIERVFLAGRSVRIQASTRSLEAACLACGTRSRRVHSRYERRLCDTAVAGQETMIHLRVRRFFCHNGGCGKTTFAEQVPGLTTRYGRWSTGLADALRAVGLALGGRAGARLAGRLAAGVSRMTLIRRIRALPDPATQHAPAVLGVDEFALRCGHSYGTLLVDVQPAARWRSCQTGRPTRSLPGWPPTRARRLSAGTEPAVMPTARPAAHPADRLAVGARSVPAHDLDARVAAQPGLQHMSLPPGQDTGPLPGLGAGQDCCVDLAAAQREVIDAEHPRHGDLGQREPQQQPQRGMP